MTVRLATIEDMEGVKALLRKYHRDTISDEDRPDGSIRGTGAFEALFFASLDQFRDRFPMMLTFVNQINKRSENAHNNKAHMETIGTFDFGDNHYFLMGIRTDAADSYTS